MMMATEREFIRRWHEALASAAVSAEGLAICRSTATVYPTAALVVSLTCRLEALSLLAAAAAGGGDGEEEGEGVEEEEGEGEEEEEEEGEGEGEDEGAIRTSCEEMPRLVAVALMMASVLGMDNTGEVRLRSTMVASKTPATRTSTGAAVGGEEEEEEAF